jgi:hypothetical protein
MEESNFFLHQNKNLKLTRQQHEKQITNASDGVYFIDLFFLLSLIHKLFIVNTIDLFFY